MNVFEIILVAVAMSLDLFGITIAQSASYARIDKKKLGFYSLAFASWEFISLILGYYTVKLLLITGITDPGSRELHLISFIILLVMAIRMLIVALRHEAIVERRRDDISFWRLMHDNFLVGFRTYLIGFAFAACETSLGLELFILVIIGVLMVIVGLYVGYRYGFDLRSKAYLSSALLLVATNISICIRYVVI